MLGGNIASSEEGATDGDPDAANGSGNVLVLAATMDGEADGYCADRLSSLPGTRSPNALLVALDDSPDRRFDAVTRRGASQPANTGIVCCDETRSAAAAQPTHGPGVGLGPGIATVSSPGDLTGLSVRIKEILSAWEADPEPVELCFHSLTMLCQYVDERTAFCFCHAVTRYLSTVDASSHFHLDPSVVDEQTVAALSALFDRVEDYT